MARADADRDGRLSYKEWQDDQWAAQLSQMDADHDHRISKAEFVGSMCSSAQDARCAKIASVEFKILDLDRDGYLEQRENGKGLELFRRMDTDHDAYVTRQQLEAATSYPRR